MIWEEKSRRKMMLRFKNVGDQGHREKWSINQANTKNYYRALSSSFIIFEINTSIWHCHHLYALNNKYFKMVSISKISSFHLPARASQVMPVMVKGGIRLPLLPHGDVQVELLTHHPAPLQQLQQLVTYFWLDQSNKWSYLLEHKTFDGIIAN